MSELATNAVVHAGTAFTVRIHTQELWVEVCDHSGELPHVRPHDVDSEGGRGLKLLAAMAEEFQIEALSDGKLVCFQPKVEYVRSGS